MKKYSVIVGTYNQKETLGITLEYLVKQTFKDFEVLVCDDGSDYDVEETFKAYKKNLSIKFFTQEHKGMRLAKNLNQGIKKARGQYIATIMGDSYPMEHWLEELTWTIGTNNIISSFRIYLDKTQEHYDWRFGNTSPKELEDIIAADTVQPWVSMTGNGLVVPAGFYKQTGGWPEEYEGYGRDDWALCLRAKKLGYKMFTDTKALIFCYGNVHIADNPKNIELFERELHE